MAEQVSRQAAKIAAGTKLKNHEALGKKSVVVITSPATVTWANGDTIASPVLLPKGTRLTAGSIVSNAAMGTSVVLDVGVRGKTGTAIDADGIAASVAVATAGRTALNNGALVAAGVEYELLEDAYVYATLSGATPTANAQIRIEVEVILPG